MSRVLKDVAPLQRLAEPIGRKTASELVVQRILDLVRGGHLGAGDRLPPERDLAVQLDVSRPTVREALRALSILGVLEIRHGGGVYVTSLDASELLSPLDFFVTLNAQNMSELFDARIQYEPMIAALAAERLTEAALGRLQELVDDQIANPEDLELFHDTDVEFHKTILEASGNLFLTRIGKLLQVLGDQGRQAFQKRRSIRAQSTEDHRVIMAALHARDPEAARRAMRQHMVNVRNALREVTGA
ncbi:MAG: FadR family transcriptional regulator [Rhodobacteraceae bacterium]|nr:FadR family transcriptional regulator [Paracoccaceae bacterium]